MYKSNPYRSKSLFELSEIFQERAKKETACDAVEARFNTLINLGNTYNAGNENGDNMLLKLTLQNMLDIPSSRWREKGYDHIIDKLEERGIDTQRLQKAREIYLSRYAMG